MLPPDSVQNIRAELDRDAHALPVWAVRALRLMLDERDVLVAGIATADVAEEIATDRRRMALASQLLVEWEQELASVPEAPPESDAHWYALGHSRAMRSCLHDLRTVLTGRV
jgi:hypothetical protein